jgi:hypothetical protein
MLKPSKNSTLQYLQSFEDISSGSVRNTRITFDQNPLKRYSIHQNYFADAVDILRRKRQNDSVGSDWF